MTYPNGTTQEELDLIDITIREHFEAQKPINDAIKALLGLGVTKGNIDDYVIYKGYDK